MSKRFIGFSILVCVVLASTLLANGPDTPPTAEDVYGLKAWIEENVSAADVSAEIEGAVSAHAGDTSTHGVSQVADEADLSAHIASTGTDVHGLGTMATEAVTDYVATSTFTGHTGDSSDPHGATLTQTTIVSDSVDGVDVSAHVTDNSDVHGCTAIASASAVADALSASNASEALDLRLDGSRAMTGSLKFSGNYGILQSTGAGSDSGSVRIGGGGAYTLDRGGVIGVYGNAYSGNGGSIDYYAGDVSTGDHKFYTGNAVNRFNITNSGFVLTPSGTAFAIGNIPTMRDSDCCLGQAIEIGDPIRFQLEQDSTTSYIHSNLYFRGGWKCYDTSRAAADIRMTCTSGDSNISFFTGSTNNSAPTEAMRITNGQRVLIGTTTDDGTNKLQVNGSMALSSFATLASPTAVPTGVEGRVYYNGTDKKLKFYNGSAWVDL